MALTEQVIIKAAEIADKLKPILDNIKDDEPAHYVQIDCGAGKSVSIPQITAMTNRSVVVATDLVERLNSYYNFTRTNIGRKNKWGYRVSDLFIDIDVSCSAMLITRDNRKFSMEAIKNGWFVPRIMVLTTQFLTSLSPEEVEELVAGKIVIIDEAWQNIAINQLSIAAEDSSNDKNVVPYAKLRLINNTAAQLINNACNNIIEAAKDGTIIVSDDDRALFAEAGELISSCNTLGSFNSLCECIAKNQVIAARAYDGSSVSLFVPVDLSAITTKCAAFINMDATAAYNTTKEISKNDVLETMPMNINLSFTHIDMAVSKQSNGRIESLEPIDNWLDDNDNGIIMPQYMYNKLKNQKNAGYFGKDNRGSNDFVDVKNWILYGVGDIVNENHYAKALYLYNTSDEHRMFKTYKELEEAELSKRFVIDYTVSNIIQSMYRCAIRQHDSDIHCNIWVCFKDFELKDAAWKEVSEYLKRRGAVELSKEVMPLPFTLDRKNTKGERAKYKTLTDYSKKNSKAGQIAKYCIDNNVAVSENVCRMFAGNNNWKITFEQLKDLPR